MWKIHSLQYDSVMHTVSKLYYYGGLKVSNIIQHPAAAAKSLQSCPALCNPIDGSPPGSLVPGILQARTLEWVAISFSNAWKWKVKVKSFTWLLATPWTAAYQAPPSMGFSRQEYWSGYHCLLQHPSVVQTPLSGEEGVNCNQQAIVCGKMYLKTKLQSWMF